MVEGQKVLSNNPSGEGLPAWLKVFLFFLFLFIFYLLAALGFFLWNASECPGPNSEWYILFWDDWDGGDGPTKCICKSDFEGRGWEGDKCEIPVPTAEEVAAEAVAEAAAEVAAEAATVVPPPCPPPLISGNCGTQKSIDTCNGYTTSGAPSGQGYRCIWVTQKPGITTTPSCDSYIRGQETDRLCTIPAAVHRPCKEDSDCMSGRCSMGDPGCYAANTCSAPRLPTEGGPSYQMLQDTAVSRMHGSTCGRRLSASGNA